MQQVKPIHVGSFELTGPEMVVTDPLYAFDAKTSVILSGCVTGKWDAYVCLSDEDIFGMRVSTLIIKAKSTEDDSCLADVLAHPYSLPKGFEAIEKGIWVDLAMAGFFDKSHYMRSTQRPPSSILSRLTGWTNRMTITASRPHPMLFLKSATSAWRTNIRPGHSPMAQYPVPATETEIIGAASTGTAKERRISPICVICEEKRTEEDKMAKQIVYVVMNDVIDDRYIIDIYKSEKSARARADEINAQNLFECASVEKWEVRK